MDTTCCWGCGWILGATLALWHIENGNERIVNSSDDMNGSYLGNEFTQNEIEKRIEKCKAKFEILNYEDLIDKTVEFLSNEKAVGWFQGRMEFVPEL